MPAGSILGAPAPPEADASASSFVSRDAKRRSAAWKPWAGLWPWPSSTERRSCWYAAAAAAGLLAVDDDSTPVCLVAVALPRGVEGADIGTLLAAVEG